MFPVLCMLSRINNILFCLIIINIKEIVYKLYLKQITFKNVVKDGIIMYFTIRLVAHKAEMLKFQNTIAYPGASESFVFVKMTYSWNIISSLLVDNL